VVKIVLHLIKSIPNPDAIDVEPQGIDPPWPAGTSLPRCGITLWRDTDGTVLHWVGAGWDGRRDIDRAQALTAPQILGVLDRLQEELRLREKEH
jgi:hypothetical protein